MRRNSLKEVTAYKIGGEYFELQAETKWNEDEDECLPTGEYELHLIDNERYQTFSLAMLEQMIKLIKSKGKKK